MNIAPRIPWTSEVAGITAMHGEKSEGERPRRVLEIDVQCYAGYRGEETPRRFALYENVIEVAEVLDAWLALDHRYFKVRGDDGACYILRNDVSNDRWELTMYDGTGGIGGVPPARLNGSFDSK